MSTYFEQEHENDNDNELLNRKLNAAKNAVRLGKNLKDYANAASSGTAFAGSATVEGTKAAAETGASTASGAGAAAETGAGAASSAGTTASSATGPIGIAIAVFSIIFKAAKKGYNDAESMLQGGRGEKKNKHNKILIFLMIPYLLVNIFSYDQARTLITPIVSDYSTSLLGEISSVFFFAAWEESIEQLKADGHIILATVSEVAMTVVKGIGKVIDFFSGLLHPKDTSEEETIDVDTIGLATDIDMDEFFKSATDADIEIIQKLGFTKAIDDALDDAEKYIKSRPDINQKRSLEVLDDITWEEVYKDVNYAEFLSIFNENEEFSANSTTLKKFKDLFDTKDERKNLYRMRFDDIEEDVFDDETGAYLYTEIWVKTTIVKYNLKKLYDFCGVDAEAYHYLYKNTKNIDVLDRSEQAERIYTSYYDFGPNVRTPWDDDFYEMDIETMLEWVAGEYPNYTSGMTSEEVWSMLEDLLNGKDITDAQKSIVEEAINRVGSAYSQTYRNSEDVYDCSSLVARVYSAAGYSIADYNPTASEECRIMENWGTTVTDTSDLQPGDVLFFSYSSSNSKYKNVTHAAIYVGNGMQIDARGSAYGVVYRESQANSHACVSVCRPLAYLAD
ncbi:MAG: C40 family peptidase [Treponema sp.]|nr:C40 family peptidase [Treponema sp.]